MYRPEGWENPYENHSAVLKEMGNEIAYEAGADAMLEALCTDENRIDCIDQYGTEPPNKVRGWLVFIPKEE